MSTDFELIYPEEHQCNFLLSLLKEVKNIKIEMEENKKDLTWKDIDNKHFEKIKQACMMRHQSNTCELNFQECNDKNCFIRLILKIVNGVI